MREFHNKQKIWWGMLEPRSVNQQLIFKLMNLSAYSKTCSKQCNKPIASFSWWISCRIPLLGLNRVEGFFGEMLSNLDRHVHFVSVALSKAGQLSKVKGTNMGSNSNRSPHPKIVNFPARWQRYRQKKQQRTNCFSLSESSPFNGYL